MAIHPHHWLSIYSRFKKHVLFFEITIKQLSNHNRFLCRMGVIPSQPLH